MGFIDTEFNPQNRGGKQRKKIKVFTSLDEEPILLHVKANIIRDPKAIKAKIGRLGLQSKKIDLGQITNQEVVTDSILVKNLGETPLTLLFGDYRTNMSWKAEPDTILPGDFGKLILTYNAKVAFRYGYKREHVPLKVQDKEIEVSSVLAVESIIVDDYSALSKVDSTLAPSCKLLKNIYSLGDVKARDVEYVEIEFRNDGKRDLVTHHVDAAREMKVVDFDVIVNPGETGKIKLKVTLPKTKFYRKSVSIFNNDPTADIQTITVMGSVE